MSELIVLSVIALLWLVTTRPPTEPTIHLGDPMRQTMMAVSTPDQEQGSEQSDTRPIDSNDAINPPSNQSKGGRNG